MKNLRLMWILYLHKIGYLNCLEFRTRTARVFGNLEHEQQGYLDMKAKISTAYYEVTLVIITYEDQQEMPK